jgi:hypothetical protein
MGPEAYLSHFTHQMTNTRVILCDKYVSGEASQDNCEEHLSFCESNGNLPRAPFTGILFDEKTGSKFCEAVPLILLQRHKELTSTHFER